jgi:hypothetical protein
MVKNTSNKGGIFLGFSQKKQPPGVKVIQSNGGSTKSIQAGIDKLKKLLK